jgi:SAM-dependent methyltransferase
MDKKDPIGNAIWDYHTNNSPQDILVESDLTEDDFLPIEHLMRTFSNFPKLEISAMKHCKGTILDIGAAAGPHTRYLLEKGHDLTTLEVSPIALRYLKEVFPQATHYSTPISDFITGQYDTILLLMNGIGLAGTFNEVASFLKHVSSLLAPGGSILCDSTDVQNIFEDEDGALWVDLNANYYGEFKFNMKYKDSESGWFNWVYVDVKNLEKFANEAGLSLTLLEDDENSFLVQLKKQI